MSLAALQYLHLQRHILTRYIAIAPADWPQGTTIAEQPGAPLPTHVRPLRRGRDGVLRESPPEDAVGPAA